MDEKYVPSTTFIAVLAIISVLVWQTNIYYALAQGGGGGDQGSSRGGLQNQQSVRGFCTICGGSKPKGESSVPGGGGVGATDSHGQVTGGGTGSVNGGTTAGGPR